MIRVRDDDVEKIRWENTVFQRFGEPLDTIVLLDNGTQGDDIGGDNIFTVDGISRRPTSEPFSTGPAPTWVYQLTLTLVYQDGTEKEVIHSRVILISLNPAVVPRASVYRGELGDFIDHTEYVIGIIDSTTNRMEIAQQYYQVMEDDRDFLFVANQPDGSMPGAGFFTHVKNTVQGIGVSEVDFTARYGSAGRLTGVVSLLPSANFLLLNHEILHQWASFMDHSLKLGRASHWDVIDRPSTGFGASGHGVFSQLEHIEENRYRGIQFNWRDQQAKAFNDFELYLMGLIDISEVHSPIRTLVNPTWLETEVDIENTIIYRNFESDGIREVTTEEVLAIHGLRSPGPEEAQTSFSGGMVVVHHRPLTLAEFAYYDFMMREYEKPDSEVITFNLTFEAATGGRADMTTRLFAPIIPNPVALLTPEPNEQHPEHSVSFSWERLSGVDHYHIQVALDATFNDMVAENQLVTGSQKVIDTFDQDTVYYWRVRAENEAGAGEWSETWSFQIHMTQVEPITVEALANQEEFGTITGTGQFDEGEEVTLTAVPEAGYHFVNWTENGAVVSENASYTFTAEKNRDLVANFAINTYSILATVNNNEYGTISGDGTYEHGETVTLHASSRDEASFIFMNWTENDTIVHDQTSYTFVATNERHLTANFQSVTSSRPEHPIVGGIQVYPNPTTHATTVTTTDRQVITGIQMYDYKGMEVARFVDVDQETFVIETANYDTGLYFIVVTTSEQAFTARLLVLH